MRRRVTQDTPSYAAEQRSGLPRSAALIWLPQRTLPLAPAWMSSLSQFPDPG